MLKEAEDYVANLVYKFGKETTMKLITESSIDLGQETKRQVNNFVSDLVDK